MPSKTETPEKDVCPYCFQEYWEPDHEKRCENGTEASHIILKAPSLGKTTASSSKLEGPYTAVSRVLNELAGIYEWDGDLIRCRSCKRGQHISFIDEAFHHRSGCKNEFENSIPWRGIALCIERVELLKRCR